MGLSHGSSSVECGKHLACVAVSPVSHAHAHGCLKCMDDGLV